MSDTLERSITTPLQNLCYQWVFFYFTSTEKKSILGTEPFCVTISGEAQGCRYQIFPWVLSLGWYLMQQLFLVLMCKISFSAFLKFTFLNSKCAKKFKSFTVITNLQKLYSNNRTWMDQKIQQYLKCCCIPWYLIYQLPLERRS